MSDFKDKIFYLTCFVLILGFGVFKVLVFPVSSPSVFENQVGETVRVFGEVIAGPEQKENNQKLLIHIEEGGEKTRVLVTVALGLDVTYGDEVSISGTLEKPVNFITDTGKEFDYVNYLAKDGIFYLVNYAKVEVLSTGGGNPMKRFLFSFKEKFLEKINYAILGNESLLMGGLILGEKAAFSQELRQEFIDTGTIHIVALSGYNITIVAEWFMKLFAFLPNTFSIGAGISSIILFVLMTGGSSTGVRAGIMAVLALVARATGRTYDISRALLLAATVMVIINPMILLYDVSFQLSFIATVAVIYLSPKLEKYFMWVPKRFGLRDVVSVTFSAYIFVLPFILYKMGNLSFVALPVNILVLPFIPLTMGLGFLTGFVGLLSSVLSLLVGHLASFFLSYELNVIHFFANISFASLTISNFPLWLTLAIYVFYIHVLFGKNIQHLFMKDI